MTMEFMNVNLDVEDVLVKLFCMEGEMKRRWNLERDACSVFKSDVSVKKFLKLRFYLNPK